LNDYEGIDHFSHAARSGHLQMIDLLLARGALAGSTALHFAAEGDISRSCNQRLIERGADVQLV
jgi:uncharacterized protein